MTTPLPPAREGPDPTSELLRRHHDGDSHALATLLERELPWIRTHVHRRLGGVVRKHLDTGDVVQEVCMQVLQNGPRFMVASAASFRRLMVRLIRNKLVSIARHYQSEKRAGERELASDSVLYLQDDAPRVRDSTPSQHAVRSEERAFVELALQLIDPLDSQILLLRDEVDLQYPEIAQRLGMAPDAVRMRYKRGLRKLASCVEQLKAGRLPDLLDELEANPDDRVGDGTGSG